ncbi:MAG: DUF1361 domain-containing protein [Leptolyngbya sp. SIO4C1]|nr:DUF1361 domain-containing protein [Leptolyngbya sp. SIO4C1]
MHSILNSWLIEGLEAAYFNLFFMVWNTFLAVIPFVLSLWLFRGHGAHARTFVWWIGFFTFVAFLPNAPYVLTDIIHLVHDIRQGQSIWAISIILVPQYFLFMLIGFEAYVAALINFNRYLSRAGQKRWVCPSELLLHGLTAIGIYLGRFLRFNSWDIVTRPDTLVIETVERVLHKQPLAIIFATFCIITVLYWLMKQLTLALLLYWRTRRLRTVRRY